MTVGQLVPFLFIGAVFTIWFVKQLDELAREQGHAHTRFVSIEDRITEILDQHSSFDGGAFTWGCTCGIDFHDSDTHNAHVARVIVTELGLTEPL